MSRIHRFIPAMVCVFLIFAAAPAALHAESPFTSLNDHVVPDATAGNGGQTATKPAVGASAEQMEKLLADLEALVKKCQELLAQLKTRLGTITGAASSNTYSARAAPASMAASSSTAGAVVGVTSWLNVRTGPWGTIIGKLHDSDKVEIMAREGDWYKIRYGSGYAYVYSGYVAPAGTVPDSATPAATTPPAAVPPSTTPAAVASDYGKTGGINGPAIPDCLMKGMEAAKKTTWFTTPNKCLQYAGTLAYKAGAHVSEANSIYPHNAYKADKTLRGYRINKLDDAALAGKLKPGMLIHVKVHYDKDPAYHVANDAHHWFVYMGTQNGVPMFADTLKKGALHTADEVAATMDNVGNALKYGDSQYGYVRRVEAVYDPFADQR